MRSKWLFGLIGCIVCLLLFTNNRIWALDSLSLVVSDANPIYANSEEGGILDRLAQEAFGRIGLTIHVTRLPSERAIELANQGHVDGDLFRIAGLEKKFSNLRMVSEPWLEMHFVAFTLQENLSLSTWQDLIPLHVAFIKGWQVFETNLKQARSITRADNSPQLFELLKQQRVDVILYDALQGEWLKQKLGMNHARIAGKPLITSPIHIYLHSKHAAMIPKVTQALRDMKQDGTWQRIMTTKPTGAP